MSRRSRPEKKGTKEKKINNFRNIDYTKDAQGEGSDQQCEKQECGVLSPVGMNTWRSTMESFSG